MSRFRRFIFPVCLFALLAILHPFWLPGCVLPLIVDQRDRPVSHVVIVDGDGRHRVLPPDYTLNASPSGACLTAITTNATGGKLGPPPEVSSTNG